MRVFAVVVAGLALAACSSTVRGKPQPFPLRSAPNTAIGDPATADLCAGVLPSVFAGYGKPEVYSQQLAGQCTVAIHGKAGAETQLLVIAVPPAEADSSGPPSEPTIFGLPARPYGDKTVCGYQLWARGVVVEAGAEDVGKPHQHSVLCLIARTLANQVAGPISRGEVPRRTAAAPTVTSIDFCQALRPSDLAGAPTVNHRGFANGCGLSTKAITLGVQAGFRPDGEKPVATVTVDGHRLSRYDAASMSDTFCGLTSNQGDAGGGRHEVIDIWTIRESGSEPRGSALCQLTERVAASVLTRLGLH
jgi:hypothetical protein